MERGFRIQLTDEAQAAYFSKKYGYCPFPALLVNARKLVLAGELHTHKKRGDAGTDEVTIAEPILEKLIGMFNEYQATRPMSKKEAMEAIDRTVESIGFLIQKNPAADMSKAKSHLAKAGDAFVAKMGQQNQDYRETIRTTEEAANFADLAVRFSLFEEVSSLAKQANMMTVEASPDMSRNELLSLKRDIEAILKTRMPIGNLDTGAYKGSGSTSRASARHQGRQSFGPTPAGQGINRGKGGGGKKGDYRR